jgi:hypothetical protein
MAIFLCEKNEALFILSIQGTRRPAKLMSLLLFWYFFTILETAFLVFMVLFEVYVGT